jgi:hypothetical protein
VLWGDEAVVRERFGANVSDLRLTRVNYGFDFPFPPAGVVEFFKDNYGPTTRAFASLGEPERTELRNTLITHWTTHNTSTDPGRTQVKGEYLEVVGVRA